MFEADSRHLFTDIVHVNSEGRQMMADRLQAEVPRDARRAGGTNRGGVDRGGGGSSSSGTRSRNCGAIHRAETFAAYDLIPRGGSGQTARWITMRFRRDLEETGARGVHLLCGVNDIGRNEGVFVPAEEIARTLAGMLDEARAMGVKAWVGSIMPAARIPWNPAVRTRRR